MGYTPVSSVMDKEDAKQVGIGEVYMNHAAFDIHYKSAEVGILVQSDEQINGEMGYVGLQTVIRCLSR